MYKGFPKNFPYKTVGLSSKSKNFLSYRFNLTFSATLVFLPWNLLIRAQNVCTLLAQCKKPDLKRLSWKKLSKTMLFGPLRIDESTKSSTLTSISPGSLMANVFANLSFHFTTFYCLNIKNSKKMDFKTQSVPTTSVLNLKVLPFIIVQLRCNSQI